MIAVGLSLLAHVSFFAVLALTPQQSTVPVQEQMKEQPLEVTIESATPTTPPQPDPIATSPELMRSSNPHAIQTQLDPENLKKTEAAPENATEIAAHNSQATHSKTSEAMPNNAARPPSRPEPSPGDSALTIQPTTPEERSSPKADPGKPKDAGPDDQVGIDAKGSYSKVIADAVNRPWESFRQKERLPVGEVLLKFTIGAGGQISDVQVISNTGTEANARFALLAVKAVKLPPIPPEVLAETPRACIEVTYRFNSYPLQ